jgi:hypothetical protein
MTMDLNGYGLSPHPVSSHGIVEHATNHHILKTLTRRLMTLVFAQQLVGSYGENSHFRVLGAMRVAWQALPLKLERVYGRAVSRRRSHPQANCNGACCHRYHRLIRTLHFHNSLKQGGSDMGWSLNRYERTVPHYTTDHLERLAYPRLNRSKEVIHHLPTCISAAQDWSYIQCFNLAQMQILTVSRSYLRQATV